MENYQEGKYHGHIDGCIADDSNNFIGPHIMIQVFPR
jgi:hypothetical protein